MNKIIIDHAEKNDLPGMLQLIKELALYEKAPDAVIVSIDDFEKYFEEGLFKALTAKIDGIGRYGLILFCLFIMERKNPLSR